MAFSHSLAVALVFAAFTTIGASGVAGQTPGMAPAPVASGGAGGFGGGGRGRGGLPGATPEQTQAVAAMATALSQETAAVAPARAELAKATFAEVRNQAAIAAAVEKVRTTELALAMKRATEFAKLQNGPNELNAEQIAALVAGGGGLAAGGRGGRGN
jgi:hypothetical protein